MMPRTKISVGMKVAMILGGIFTAILAVFSVGCYMFDHVYEGVIIDVGCAILVILGIVTIVTEKKSLRAKVNAFTGSLRMVLSQASIKINGAQRIMTEVRVYDNGMEYQKLHFIPFENVISCSMPSKLTFLFKLKGDESFSIICSDSFFSKTLQKVLIDKLGKVVNI